MVSPFFMIKFKKNNWVWTLSALLVFFHGLTFCENVAAFEKAQIQIKGSVINVEIASTELQRAQGLMGRKSLAENQGMLFVFPTPQNLTFWMKGTLMDLSIGFFDNNRLFLHALEMKQPASSLLRDDQLPRYSSQKPAQYALEMPAGWFTKKRLKPGDSFEWVKPKP